MPASKFPDLPILIVDDEKTTLKSLEIMFHTIGMNHVLTCHDSRNVLNTMAHTPVSLVLLDLMMPHLEGDQLLSQIQQNFPEIPVIVITAKQDLETAVECMRLGAYDYVTKPVEQERLVNSVYRVLEYEDLQKENQKLRHLLLEGKFESPQLCLGIITQNPKMHAIFQYCHAIAHTMKPILISGETGTGKELIAKAIHQISGRSGKFVGINVAGFDDNLFTDTLFGHVKGAFTSADTNRKGMVEMAEGGSLFLDEIGELSLLSQVKLLRLLQEREFSAVGDDKIRVSNARIIVATNLDLMQEQAKGKFRKDLYYRLISHHIHLPPLRERLEDIEPLLNHFLIKEAKELQKKKPTYHPELISLLQSYHFPGNIRELEAMVGDAMAIHHSKMLSSQVFVERIGKQLETLKSSQTYDKDDTSIFAPENMETLLPLKQAVSLFTEKWISEAMKRAQGNQTVAAQLLGISQQTLSYKLKHN